MKSSYNLNIASLVEMHLESKVLHWQTKKYAMHVALGDFYSAMDALIDKFVETSQSKYGRVSFDRNINIKNLSEFNSMVDLVKQYITPFETFLITELVKPLDEEVDSDLINLRDEMLSELNKLKYLLTLK